MRWDLRVFSLSTLRIFWLESKHADSEQPLRAWYAIARRANWATPHDIKQDFGHARFVGGNRVVFNIAGNKYRLVVRFNYPYRVAYIRFVGTHKQYDSIDVEKI